MTDIKGKVIWITGASSGFGKALSYELATQGAKLIISSRRKNELEQIKAQIPSIAILPLDLEQHDLLATHVESAISIYGHIDIMIHNGGIGQRSNVLDTAMDLHRKIMQVDYFSYIELTKLLLPHFIERQSGHFVVTSGVMGKVAMPLRSAYCAAKFALHGFFESLRAEIKQHNIDVTILVPGAMQTNLVKKINQDPANANEEPVSEVQTGCSVGKAAQQAALAIKNQVAEVYIGNKDKGALLLLLNRLCPNRVRIIVAKLM